MMQDNPTVARLKARLDPQRPAIAMAAHNPLATKLAAAAGFDAIWGSGFELSASYAVPVIGMIPPYRGWPHSSSRSRLPPARSQPRSVYGGIREAASRHRASFFVDRLHRLAADRLHRRLARRERADAADERVVWAARTFLAVAGLTLGGIDRLALTSRAAARRKPCAVGTDADVPGRDVVPRGSAVAGQSQAPAVERALHSRRHIAGSLGEPQELSAEGRVGRTSRSGRNGEQDFHGERRTNDTQVSTTDPDARLYHEGPGKEARTVFHGATR